jgi:WD40 repeat protein
MAAVLSWLLPEPTVEYTEVRTDCSACYDELPNTTVANVTGPVTCMLVVFDKYVVCGGYQQIQVLRLDSGECISTIRGDFGTVTNLSLVYGTTTLVASAHSDGEIRTWDFFGDYSEEADAQPDHLLSGHFNSVTVVGAIQGVAPILVSGSLDGTLRVWDLNTQEVIAFSFHRKGILKHMINQCF